MNFLNALRTCFSPKENVTKFKQNSLQNEVFKLKHEIILLQKEIKELKRKYDDHIYSQINNRDLSYEQFKPQLAYTEVDPTEIDSSFCSDSEFPDIELGLKSDEFDLDDTNVEVIIDKMDNTYDNMYSTHINGTQYIKPPDNYDYDSDLDYTEETEYTDEEINYPQRSEEELQLEPVKELEVEPIKEQQKEQQEEQDELQISTFDEILKELKDASDNGNDTDNSFDIIDENELSYK